MRVAQQGKASVLLDAQKRSELRKEAQSEIEMLIHQKPAPSLAACKQGMQSSDSPVSMELEISTNVEKHDCPLSMSMAQNPSPQYIRIAIGR